MSRKILPFVVMIFLICVLACMGMLMKISDGTTEIDKLQQTVEQQLEENGELLK